MEKGEATLALFGVSSPGLGLSGPDQSVGTGMTGLQVRGARVLAWLLWSVQEECLCLESQLQHPERRDPERQAGTAGHRLAVGGMSMVREPQLSGDVPARTGTWSCGPTALGGKERDSLRAQGATGYSEAPKGLHSFLSPLFSKDRNGS